MSIPKLCFDKVFWICISACIGFTVFIDQSLEPQIGSVQAQVEKNTQSIGSILTIHSDISDMKAQLEQQTQDIADIKAELKLSH